MSDQLLRLDDAGLEAALRDLGTSLAYPAAPSLVDAVHARLATQPPPGAAWW